MAKEIIWSNDAEETFDLIVSYLAENWSENVAHEFSDKVIKMIGILAEDNVRFRKSKKRDFYEVLITKHNLLIYQVDEKRITLLLFFDTRQHSSKLKY